MKAVTESMYSKKGLSRVELILTIAGLLALAGLLLFAVLDTQRRSRDAGRVSTLRQIEFDLAEYRNAHASFPESIELLYQGAAVPGYTYNALPAGCRADAASLCSAYTISFVLEGRIGILSGGTCESSPDGIVCIKQ